MFSMKKKKKKMEKMVKNLIKKQKKHNDKENFWKDDIFPTRRSE